MSVHTEGLQNFIVNMQEHMRIEKLLIKGEKEHIRHYKAKIKNDTDILRAAEKSVELYKKSVELSKKCIAETRERLKTEE